MKRYGSFDQAQARVIQLRRTGTWPGIVCHKDGTYSLAYDPGDAAGETA